MPYFIPWSGLTIDGAIADADDIDLHLTNVAEALKERLEGSLIVSVTADPWVLKDSAGGPVTGKRLLIPHTLFTPLTGHAGTIRAGDIITVDQQGEWIQAPVILPPGVTVTLIEFLVNMSTADTLNWKFFATALVAGTAGVEVPLRSGTNIVTGAQIFNSGVISDLIATDKFYHLAINLTGVGPSGYILYGARITYNVPSSKETL